MFIREGVVMEYMKAADIDYAECFSCVYFNEYEDGEICMLTGEETMCCSKACAGYTED